MSRPELNVDCGCLIFLYLAIPEAIRLSRTDHFWYDLSSRRVAYRPMNFPSFQEGFDILAYREWQESGRQKLRLTLRQLIQFSTSRVIQHGLHDLELILDSSLFVKLKKDVLSAIISLYQSVVALTITIKYEFSRQHQPLTVQLDYVDALLTHLAPNLISFQLHPTASYGNVLQNLSESHSQLCMPKLLHAVIPLKMRPDAPWMNDTWCVRWETLKPFQPAAGVLDISAPYNDYEYDVRVYDKSPIKLSLGHMDAPVAAHILFTPPKINPRPLIGYDHRWRSLRMVLPVSPRELTRELFWGELLPPGIDVHYQEVNLTLLEDFLSCREDIDLSPLRSVASSFRILNLEMDCSSLNEFDLLISQLSQDAGVRKRTPGQQATDNETDSSPFTHVTQVRITRYRTAAPLGQGRACLDLSRIGDICPKINHLEVFTPISLVDHTFPFHQLRHLTTPLPVYTKVHVAEGPIRNHTYIQNLMLGLRQLESLHLILDWSHLPIDHHRGSGGDGSHFLDSLVWSSANLTEVTCSYDPRLRLLGWLTNDSQELADFHQWLIHMHLIWQCIQSSHPLPIDQIALTPATVTSIVDLLPLLSTFIRDPGYRLPYLILRCQRFAETNPPPSPPPPSQPNWFKRVGIATSKFIFALGAPWLLIAASNMNGRSDLPLDRDLGQFRRRLELTRHFSTRSHAFRQRLTRVTETLSQFPCNRQHHHLEQRTHFRITLQLD